MGDNRSPLCESPDGDDRSPAAIAWLRSPMLYPNAYVWFVFVSAMDVMLTWAILTGGGSEVNPIAARIIAGWGLPGALVFKFGLTIFVILVCEIVGRARSRLGVSLAFLAVGISSIPVAYSLFLLSVRVFVHGEVIVL